MRPSTQVAAQAAAAVLGRRLLAVAGDQRAHAVGGLRALADPVVDARQIELQLRVLAARDRVEVPHVLEARAALALAAVGHDDVIEGLIARAAPRQANCHHDDRSVQVARGPKKSADSTQTALAPVFDGCRRLRARRGAPSAAAACRAACRPARPAIRRPQLARPSCSS